MTICQSLTFNCYFPKKKFVSLFLTVSHSEDEMQSEVSVAMMDDITATESDEEGKQQTSDDTLEGLNYFVHHAFPLIQYFQI